MYDIYNLKRTPKVISHHQNHPQQYPQSENGYLCIRLTQHLQFYLITEMWERRSKQKRCSLYCSFWSLFHTCPPMEHCFPFTIQHFLGLHFPISNVLTCPLPLSLTPLLKVHWILKPLISTNKCLFFFLLDCGGSGIGIGIGHPLAIVAHLWWHPDLILYLFVFDSQF